MNVLKLKNILRKAVISGMAMTSIFGSPLPKIKGKEDDENDPLRLVEDDGIICTENVAQEGYSAWTELDDHLYRYESLENLVAFDNEMGGNFWKSATLSSREPNTYTLRGTRSDGVSFSVEKSFDIRDKHNFDQLCQDFNKKLSVETA